MSSPHPTIFLLQWFSRYLKNRDLVFRKIDRVQDGDTDILVFLKDGKKARYLVLPFTDDLLSEAQSITEDVKGLVLYNTPENYESMLKQWDSLSKIAGLTIYFINPYSTTEKKWIISPRTHMLVSDPDSFKEGLQAMRETVEPITRADIEKLTAP